MFVLNIVVQVRGENICLGGASYLTLISEVRCFFLRSGTVLQACEDHHADFLGN